MSSRAEWIEAANPLQGFMADACKPNARARVALGDLHAAMATWCRAERQPMRLTRKALARQLRGAGYTLEKVAGLTRVMGVALAKRSAPDKPNPRRAPASRIVAKPRSSSPGASL